jgi:LacI family transcriptional regulator
MPTVKDVASRANVSPGTVSNVLTGKRPVSTATRARVTQAIEELGYHPNILARSLINRRSETLAVVASGLEYFGPSQTIVGIEREADELGYSVLLRLIHWSDDRQAALTLDALAGRQVDGIIWAVPEIGQNRAWVSRSRLEKLPPIVFVSMAGVPGVTSVSVDNRAGARLATEHLVAEGRRCIGFVGGPPDWWEARQREVGWHEMLQAAGAAVSPDLRIDGNWSAASGENALLCLLSRQPRLDAVFAANDQMALGVLRAAHLSGCKVPDDIAVVGFDDLPEAACFWPPLTTVRQRLLDVGRQSTRLLSAMIDARATGREEAHPCENVLQPELIVRESSVRTERRLPTAPCDTPSS